jgi:hypothetical protein
MSSPILEPKHEAGSQQNSARCPLHTRILLRSLFDPKEGGDMFLREVSWLSPDYMALYPRSIIQTTTRDPELSTSQTTQSNIKFMKWWCREQLLGVHLEKLLGYTHLASNSNVHYHAHKIPPLDPVLSHKTAVHTISQYLRRAHFSLSDPLVTDWDLPNLSLSFSFPTKFGLISHLPLSCYTHITFLHLFSLIAAGVQNRPHYPVASAPCQQVLTTCGLPCCKSPSFAPVKAGIKLSVSLKYAYGSCESELKYTLIICFPMSPKQGMFTVSNINLLSTARSHMNPLSSLHHEGHVCTSLCSQWLTANRHEVNA